MEILIILGLTVGLLTLAFAGIGIKMFLKKDGRFEKKSCCSTTGEDTNSCACSVNSDR